MNQAHGWCFVMHESIGQPDQTPPVSELPGARRITVKGARRMLGMIGKNYDDEDLTEILDILYGIAEVSYDKFRQVEHDDEDWTS